MKKNHYCVYKHTNKINGKVYIGQTGQKPENRWQEGRGYKGSDRFYKAIQKYGWDNFEHEVLFSHLSQKEAKTLEQKLIQEYNTINPLFGYNLTTGGETTKFSEEALKKMSQSHSKEKHHMWGKHHSEETKKKIGEANSGENSSWYGRKHTEEEKEKIRNALKGKKKSKEHVMKANITKGYPVQCIETQEIYYSMKEAKRKTGISDSSIGASCRDTKRTAGGYHWQFLEKDYFKNLEENKT